MGLGERQLFDCDIIIIIIIIGTRIAKAHKSRF